MVEATGRGGRGEEEVGVWGLRFEVVVEGAWGGVVHGDVEGGFWGNLGLDWSD